MWFYAQHMQQMANYTLKLPAPSSNSLLKLASVQHRNCKIFPTHLSPIGTPKRQKHPKSMDIKSRFKHKMKESSCYIDSNSIQTAMITRMTPIWSEAQIHQALTNVFQRHMATQSMTNFASSYCQPSETTSMLPSQVSPCAALKQLVTTSACCLAISCWLSASICMSMSVSSGMSICMSICNNVSIWVGMSISGAFLATKLAGCVGLVGHICARVAPEEPHWLQREASWLYRHDREVLGAHNVGHPKAMPQDGVMPTPHWPVLHSPAKQHGVQCITAEQA